MPEATAAPETAETTERKRRVRRKHTHTHTHTRKNTHTQVLSAAAGVPVSQMEDPVLQHNLCVFRAGDGATRVRERIMYINVYKCRSCIYIYIYIYIMYRVLYINVYDTYEIFEYLRLARRRRRHPVREMILKIYYIIFKHNICLKTCVFRDGDPGRSDIYIYMIYITRTYV